MYRSRARLDEQIRRGRRPASGAPGRAPARRCKGSLDTVAKSPAHPGPLKRKKPPRKSMPEPVPEGCGAAAVARGAPFGGETSAGPCRCAAIAGGRRRADRTAALRSRHGAKPHPARGRTGLQAPVRDGEQVRTWYRRPARASRRPWRGGRRGGERRTGPTVMTKPQQRRRTADPTSVLAGRGVCQWGLLRCGHDG